MVKKSVPSTGKKEGESLGVSGFTLGVVSLVLVVFSPILGIMTSIVGFVFCVVQQRRKPTKLGRSGIVLNVLGFIANIVWMILLVKILIPIIDQQLQINSLG